MLLFVTALVWLTLLTVLLITMLVVSKAHTAVCVAEYEPWVESRFRCGFPPRDGATNVRCRQMIPSFVQTEWINNRISVVFVGQALARRLGAGRQSEAGARCTGGLGSDHGDCKQVSGKHLPLPSPFITSLSLPTSRAGPWLTVYVHSYYISGEEGRIIYRVQLY